ncbi:hypothetical protein H0A36_14520 [Endozoicomonas sp. SM1973]|uniref:Uncharacterized protein n=1 Tax=Spartinivicinus marinus TaxID=2994442 RepID=A0A853I3N1_9GAMM|nr:hypothetical protein [Spartinivicinus marinus]MCX4028562.1 hypothetical protein [Spartinivicinus marinus]NYZ67229.1 hypothetical protein [Spartinivicinus marinus]
MSDLLVFLGILLIVLTIWEIRSDTTDPSMLFDYINPLDYFDITRDKHPIMFWSIISFQLVIGFSLIVYGLAAGWS